jgi:hypothetical protein
VYEDLLLKKMKKNITSEPTFNRQTRNKAQKERHVCSKTFQQIRQYTVMYKRKVVKMDGTELILVRYNHETQGIVF